MVHKRFVNRLQCRGRDIKVKKFKVDKGLGH
jgi:hypothetical protein